MAGAAPGCPLLVAKVIKIDDRCRQPDRLLAKDGLDVLRLLRASEAVPLATRLAELTSDRLAGTVTVRAVGALREHGRDPDGLLATLAARAVGLRADPDTIARSLTALVNELLAELR